MIIRPPVPGSFYERAYSDLSHKPREQWPSRIPQLVRAYGGHDAPEVVKQKLLNLTRIIQRGRDAIVAPQNRNVGTMKLAAEVWGMLRK